MSYFYTKKRNKKGHLYFFRKKEDEYVSLKNRVSKFTSQKYVNVRNIFVLTFFIGFTTSANENDDNDDNQKGDNTCRDHSHDYDDVCTAHLL